MSLPGEFKKFLGASQFVNHDTSLAQISRGFAQRAVGSGKHKV